MSQESKLQTLDFETIAQLSERDLKMLIEPGLKIEGFKTVESVEEFAKQIAISILREHMKDYDYINYEKNILSLGAEGPVDAAIKKRRDSLRRATINSRVTKPICLEILAQNKSSLKNSQSVLEPVINLKITGEVYTFNPNLVEIGMSNPMTVKLNDELIIYARLRSFGTGKVKPYISMSVQPLDTPYFKVQESKVEKSSERWRQAITYALRHPYSAGSPGLGKRG